MPGFAFAPVGRLGLSSPPSRPLLRPSLLCSAKTTASPSQVASLCRSLPDTSLVPIWFVSLSARQQAGDSPLAPGPLVYRFAVLLRLLSHEEMAVLSSCRDRNATRACVRSMTSNVSTVSGFVAKGHQTMTSRFRKPPYDPGQSDFPSHGSDLGLSSDGLPAARKLKC